MASASELFEQELIRRGLTFERHLPLQYVVVVKTRRVEVNLDNLVRDFARDGDAQRVRQFADAICNREELPEWEDARRVLFWSAEPAELELGDALIDVISPQVRRVLVLTDADESSFRFVTPDAMTHWGVTQAQLRATADENQARLLSSCEIEVDEVDGTKLGMVPLQSALKASVIFAPNFKAFVEDALGWPVLALIPCRDFIFLVAERDQEIMGRMGDVVLREYRESGYPIATEVLRIDDAGIKAIGVFRGDD